MKTPTLHQLQAIQRLADASATREFAKAKREASKGNDPQWYSEQAHFAAGVSAMCAHLIDGTELSLE